MYKMKSFKDFHFHTVEVIKQNITMKTGKEVRILEKVSEQYNKKTCLGFVEVLERPQQYSFSLNQTVL